MEDKTKEALYFLGSVIKAVGNNLDEKGLYRVIDYAVQKVMDINKESNKNPDDEIYFGDIVLIEEDYSEVNEYFISGSRFQRMQQGNALYKHNELSPSKYKNVEPVAPYYYKNIVWNTELGQAIIGKYVGDTFDYYEKGIKHSVRIISHERTEVSEKINYESEFYKIHLGADNHTKAVVDYLKDNPDFYKNQDLARSRYLKFVEENYPCEDMVEEYRKFGLYLQGKEEEIDLDFIY